MKQILVILFMFTAVPGVSGQPLETERFLVPIVIDRDDPIPGSRDSLWASTILFRNETSGTVEVTPHPRDCPGIGTCPPAVSFPPGSTVELALSETATVKAALVSVTKSSPGAVTFNLRVRDLSRQSQTWGTDVPVVSEREFLDSAITLLGVPVTNEFRHSLRLYEVSGTFRPVTFVRVRVFGADPEPHFGGIAPPPDTLLGEAVVAIQPAPPGHHLAVPGYAEIHLGQVASLAGWDLVTVEIEPVTEDLQYWAFISVTNNETQHITTITPR